jgi:parallel beta-helix repeat protein
MLPSLAVALLAPQAVSAYTTHLPILIDGNGDFTSSNGVSGGTGSPADPYVIQGWEIDASLAHGIEIRNTDASFLIRDVYVHSGGQTFRGISLDNVQNGTVENAVLTDNGNGLVYWSSANLTFSGIEATSNHASGIYGAFGTNVTTTASTLSYNNNGMETSGDVDAAIVGNDISSNQAHGIRAWYPEGIRVLDNSILGSAGVGVYLNGAQDVEIVNNTVAGGGNTGLVVRSSVQFSGSSIRIERNNISANGYNGIAVDQGRSVFILDNVISENTYGGYLQSLFSATVWGNTVSSNKGEGLRFAGLSYGTIEDNVFSGNGGAGLEIGASDSTVRGNQLVDNGDAGAHVWYSERTSVELNTIEGNLGEGIFLEESDRITVSRNSIAGNGRDGIRVGSATNASLLSNTISHDGQGPGEDLFDIRLDSSFDALLEGNALLSNGLAIFGDSVAHYGSHTITTDNLVHGKPLRYYRDCSGQTVVGLDLGQLIFANCRDVTAADLQIGEAAIGALLAFVDGGTVTGNAFSSSTYGVYVTSSTGILVHGNDFVDNAHQAHDDRVNSWDNGYPSGGNRWSDYQGIDRCSGPGQDVCQDPDGIGDTPYRAGSYLVDRYPLVPPNAVPLAAFNLSGNATTVNATLIADASPSSDAEDPSGILKVRWDWENDGIWDTEWTTRKVAIHQYSTAGTYTVRLEVRDTGGLVAGAVKDVEVRYPPGPEDEGLSAPLYALAGAGVVGVGLALAAFVYVEVIASRKGRRGGSS